MVGASHQIRMDGVTLTEERHGGHDSRLASVTNSHPEVVSLMGSRRGHS